MQLVYLVYAERCNKSKVTWMHKQEHKCLQMQMSSQTLPSRCSALPCSSSLPARYV